MQSRIVNLQDCKRTLSAHVESSINQHPQILLPRASPNLFAAQPVPVLEIAPAQMQYLTLGFVELHKIGMVWLLKPVQVPLGSIPLVCQLHPQIGVVCKLAEGSLDSLPMSPTKMLNNNSPSSDLWGASLNSGLIRNYSCIFIVAEACLGYLEGFL